jgi:hypothetical protein
MTFDHPTRQDVARAADLDNYAHPLASRLKNSGLVSVWCTKQQDEQSFVRIEAARQVPSPSGDVLVVRTTTSWETCAPRSRSTSPPVAVPHCQPVRQA